MPTSDVLSTIASKVLVFSTRDSSFTMTTSSPTAVSSSSDQVIFAEPITSCSNRSEVAKTLLYEDLDSLLATESEEERNKASSLDVIDKAIASRKAASESLDKLFEVHKKSQEKSIEKLNNDRAESKSRAEFLKRISVVEMRSYAQKLLDENEDIASLSERRRLYFQSAGDCQSLFYKQIWDPFTDGQYGKVDF